MPGLPHRDTPALSAATAIASILHDHGFRALVAGGCVRDHLLGRTAKDADIATDATPDAIARIFPGAKAIGRAFGVMLVREADSDFEVATFRRDGEYRDGRHPVSVTFSNEVEDAQRRDFTINALFYDPLRDEIIDHVGGLADLASRRIRAVGDPGARFREDALRLLRAIRFASVLGFTIEERTMDAIRKQAGDLSRISIERIATELTRMLTESALPGNAVALLRDTGLLAHVLPEVAALDGVPQPPEYHPEGDALTHTILVLNHVPHPTPELAFAAILHDIGKAPTFTRTRDKDGTERIRFDQHASVGARMAEDVLQRLRQSRRLTETVAECVAHHMRFIDIQRMRKATLLRWITSPTFPVELALHRADCLASHGKLDNHDFALASLESLRNTPAISPPILRGDDVLALGVTPGPEIAQILREARDAQMEAAFTTREDALAWLRERVSRSGSR